MAPPLAGKGTQGEILAKYLNIPHLSVGAFLRNRAEVEDDLGKELNKIMQDGQLVKSNISIGLIREHLSIENIDNGFILDGFPRNLEQAHLYDELLKELSIDQNIVVFIDLTLEQALLRLSSRYTCMNCGETYNYSDPELSPQKEGVCDKCGDILEHRDDDNHESLMKRFDLYHQQTYPLIQYYSDLSTPIIKIDGNQSKYLISQAIINYFKENNHD